MDTTQWPVFNSATTSGHRRLSICEGNKRRHCHQACRQAVVGTLPATPTRPGLHPAATGARITTSIPGSPPAMLLVMISRLSSVWMPASIRTQCWMQSGWEAVESLPWLATLWRHC